LLDSVNQPLLIGAGVDPALLVGVEAQDVGLRALQRDGRLDLIGPIAFAFTVAVPVAFAVALVFAFALALAVAVVPGVAAVGRHSRIGREDQHLPFRAGRQPEPVADAEVITEEDVSITDIESDIEAAIDAELADVTAVTERVIEDELSTF